MHYQNNAAPFIFLTSLKHTVIMMSDLERSNAKLEPAGGIKSLPETFKFATKSVS